MIVVQNDAPRSRVGVVGQASVGVLGGVAAVAAGAVLSLRIRGQRKAAEGETEAEADALADTTANST